MYALQITGTLGGLVGGPRVHPESIIQNYVSGLCFNYNLWEDMNLYLKVQRNEYFLKYNNFHDYSPKICVNIIYKF